MTTNTSMQKVIIVPGMGCTPLEGCNWYRWLEAELNKKGGYKVILEEMLDPYECKESIWLPFIKSQGVDKDTILIGHSSGSEAIMRLAEDTEVKGLILVSACHTDLGSESERVSGYYNREWQWNKIRENTQFIVQIHAVDDKFIPVAEARHVAEHLKSTYLELPKGGHFMHQKIPVVVEELEKVLNQKAS